MRWRIATKVGQGAAGIRVGPGESLHPCSAKSSAEQLVSHKQNLLVQYPKSTKSRPNSGWRMWEDSRRLLHAALSLEHF